MKILWKPLELNCLINTKTYKRISNLLGDQSDIIKADQNDRIRRLKQNTSTKRSAYCALNPSLKQHSVYKSDTLKEYKRKEFTRFCVSSHNLKIETGRWGRVERENRTCSCNAGGVQDENRT